MVPSEMFFLYFLAKTKDLKQAFAQKYNPNQANVHSGNENESFQNNDSYTTSVHFDSAPAPVFIDKLFSISTGGVFKYLWNTPVSFMATQWNYSVFFCSLGKMYAVSINKNGSTSLKSFDLKLEDPKMYGNLFVNKDYVILTMANGQIFIFSHTLSLEKKLTSKLTIASRACLIEDKLYFIDVADGFNKLALNGECQVFTPENLGSNFNNCSDGFLLTDKWIVYGSTTSSFYVLDRQSLKLLKIVRINSDTNYIKNKPVVYKNLLILSSDKETVAINSETLETLWTISAGSFSQPIIHNDLLFLGNENFLSFFTLTDCVSKPTLKGEIFFGPNNFIMQVFIFNKSVFVVDSKGHFYLVHYLAGKFQKCHNDIETKHVPTITIVNQQCFVLSLSNFGDLDVSEITGLGKALEKNDVVNTRGF